MARYGNLFISLPFQTPELISQTLQPSQNPVKDARGTLEHGTSTPTRRRIWNFDVSFRIGEALLHINPTCGAETELGVQNATETVLNGTGHIGKKNCTTGHTLFDFQTLELISQSLQLFQNGAKDPRGTPEHGTSSVLCRRPCNFYLSSRNVEVVIDINPTCGAETELGVQNATETVLNGTGHIGKKNCTTGHSLFDFQTIELISQSLQPSQNPVKVPRGTHEHGTSTFLRRRLWNRQVSSRIVEVVLHTHPTCGVEAELGIQTATETVLDWTYPKYRTAQRATLHS